MDYSILQEKIQKLGISITVQALRGWFKGVLAPQDEQIIFLIIELSNLPSVINNKHKIRSAIRSIRGLHISVGRRLRDIIKKSAVSTSAEKILKHDDLLSLVVEDVVSTALFLRVKAMKPVFEKER
jgi:hypothetical protein